MQFSRSAIGRITLKGTAILIFVLIVGGIGGYFVGNSGATYGTCVFYTFSEGSNSYCVSGIQGMIDADYYRTFGNNPHYASPDGIFGPITKGAVEQFQRTAFGIYGGGAIPADGVVGSRTWHKICDVTIGYGFSVWGTGCYNPAF